jgi:hypothetical protein
MQWHTTPHWSRQPCNTSVEPNCLFHHVLLLSSVTFNFLLERITWVAFRHVLEGYFLFTR